MSKIKIIVVILILCFIALILLNFINESSVNSSVDNNWEKKFYAQEFNQDKKYLFFVGSSLAAFINQTYVENYLKTHGQDYEVYNLGIGYDLPKERIKSIDMIIPANPDVIVYVIGFRDLRAEGIYEDNKTAILPDTYPSDLYLKAPYVRETVNYIPTTPLVQLQVFLKDWKNQWPINTNDINAISLEKIVSKISENNIKLMILVNPHHPIYLNAIPEEEKKSFFTFLDELSAKYNIDIIDFHDRYSNLEIWLDLIHIGHSTDSDVYYADVAKAILDNLRNDTQSQKST